MAGEEDELARILAAEPGAPEPMGRRHRLEALRLELFALLLRKPLTEEVIVLMYLKSRKIAAICAEVMHDMRIRREEPEP